MTTSTDDRIRDFLQAMASEAPSPDTRAPSRVKRRARLGMAGWSLATAMAVVAVPLAAFAALRAMPGDGSNLASPDLEPLVAFERGNSRIWLMAPDGSEQRPLTPAGDYATDPDWAPDGERIVYVSDHRLQIIDVETEEVETLPATPGGDPIGPQWAPDGTSIAFADALPSGKGGGIYLLTLEDETMSVITEDAAGGGLLSWSPDGLEIAFTREKGDTSNIWAVDVATGETRQISDAGFGFDPAWSPDGSLIAYFNSQIWVVNTDGSGHALAVTDMHGCEALNPHWSPDGSWITFYSCEDSGPNDLYRIHPDGTGLTQLTDTPAGEKGGDWRPA
jgi:TolB protein